MNACDLNTTFRATDDESESKIAAVNKIFKELELDCSAMWPGIPSTGHSKCIFH